MVVISRDGIATGLSRVFSSYVKRGWHQVSTPVNGDSGVIGPLGSSCSAECGIHHTLTLGIVILFQLA